MEYSLINSAIISLTLSFTFVATYGSLSLAVNLDKTLKDLLKPGLIGMVVTFLIILTMAYYIGPTEFNKWTLPNSFKDLLQAAQSLAAIIGVSAGVRWFFRRGRNLPRVNITHKVEHWVSEDDLLLVEVEVTLSNLGEIPLTINGANLKVYQVKPLSKSLKDAFKEGKEGTLIELMQLEKSQLIRIDPGETDCIPFKFLLSTKAKEGNELVSKLEVFKLESFLPKPGKNANGHGWGTSTNHEIKYPDDETLPKPRGLLGSTNNFIN